MIKTVKDLVVCLEKIQQTLESIDARLAQHDVSKFNLTKTVEPVKVSTPKGKRK